MNLDFFYVCLLVVGWCPSTLGKAICFAQSTNWNASVFWKRPPATPRNNISCDIQASCGPVKFTDKIHHHSHVLLYLSLSWWSGMQQKNGCILLFCFGFNLFFSLILKVIYATWGIFWKYRELEHKKNHWLRWGRRTFKLLDMHFYTFLMLSVTLQVDHVSYLFI